jgi:hypothetical protein
MTTPRKMFAAVALAAVALFVTTGLALANPEHVNDGGRHGGHSHSHTDHYNVGDDNDCNYKYRRDGSRNPDYDGDAHCPTRQQTNPPNPAYDRGGFSFPGL